MSRVQPERVRANARALRVDGLSITDIAQRVGVARQTASAWLQGVGEYYRVGTCPLCGDRFVASTPRQRFCCTAHREKYKRIYKPPSPAEAERAALARRVRDLRSELRVAYERRAGQLERELAGLRRIQTKRRARA